jgi:hypothetical protein
MFQDLWIRTLSAVALVTSLVACNSNHPRIVPVSGKLTRNGQPVANLEVHFVPEMGPASSGMSDAEGRFTLAYAPEEPGAAVGKNTVFVTFNPPDNPTGDRGFASPSNLNQILAKYGSKEISTLQVEIVKEVNDLELKLD